MAFNMGNIDAVLELSAKVDGVTQILSLERALQDVKGELNKYEKAQKTSTAQSGLFNAATVALGGFMLDAAYKAAEFVKQSVALGFSFEQTQTRLRMLSEGYGEYDAVQAIVTANAKTLGQSQAQAANGFADIYARLRPLGVGLEDVNAVYLGFNSLAMQSGTTAEAASGAFMQLSQALGSGTLRGDEFNSVAEQVPGILTEVAEVMGQPVGALRGLAAQGKITSDVVIQAMRNAAAEGGASLGELTQSAANAGNRLSVAFQDAQAMIGRELVPALAPFMDGLTAIVKTATELLVPATRMVSEGWQWFGKVMSEQILPVFDPLVASVQRLMQGLNVTDLAKAWQGFAVMGVSALTDLLEFQVGVWAKVVDAVTWLSQTPALRFVAEQVGKWVDYLVEVRDGAIASGKAFEAVSPVVDAIGGAISAAGELLSRIFMPAVDGIVVGWRSLYDVLTQQVLPAFQPIVDAAQRLVSDLDIAEIVELWANGMANALQTVTGYIDYMGGLWRQLADALYIEEIIAFYREAWVGALKLVVDGIQNVSKAWAFTLDVIKQLVEDSPFVWILKRMGLWRTETTALAADTRKVEAAVASVTEGTEKARVQTEGVRKSTELTKEELKAQEEARKKLLEQIKEESKYADAITDKQRAILSVQMDQLERQREKYNGTEMEFSVLLRIRDAKLKEAEIDYKAAQAKIRAQVELGQMTEKEAQVRLEILKIQYDSTKATINRTSQQEILNERAERLKQITQETVVETVTLTQEAEKYTAEIERATTHVIKLHGELREVDAAVVRISRGWMSVQNETLLAADAAYNYEQFIKSSADRIIDLRKEGTQAANALADALLGALDDKQLDAVRDQFRKSGTRGDGSIPRFATGGYVDKPTVALVSEGGEPEYIIPQSKMLSALTNFLLGSRGNSVLTANPGRKQQTPEDVAMLGQFDPNGQYSRLPADLQAKMRKGFLLGAGQQNQPQQQPQLNITTGPVLNFNGQQYVTVQDMQKALMETVSQILQMLTGNAGVRQMARI